MSEFAQISLGYVGGRLIGELIGLVLLIAFLWKASR